jgi:hypothetical protein
LGKSGKHLLALSFSHFDPRRTSVAPNGCAAWSAYTQRFAHVGVIVTEFFVVLLRVRTAFHAAPKSGLDLIRIKSSANRLRTIDPTTEVFEGDKLLRDENASNVGWR